MNLYQLLKIIAEDFSVYCKYRWYHPKFYLSMVFSLRFHVIFLYRIGNYLYYRASLCRFLNYPIQYFMQVLSGCHIDFSAKIGRRIRLPHPIGIVIGRGVVIGNDVLIYQNVTIGGEKALDPQYPIIKSNVKLYANAIILGNITVGENAVVGSCSLVLKSVPDGSTVFGIPARVRPNYIKELSCE